MGIVHFMPLGKSPGAVTAPLSWLKNKYGERTAEWGRTIEEIVLYTTLEIKEGCAKEHRAEYCCWNRYGKVPGPEKRDENAVSIVLDFIRKEIAGTDYKPKVHWCEAFANDYKKSFRSAAEAMVLYLSKPERTGKNVWINITGGTNIMNVALMQVALLSGLASQVYYAFVPESNTSYLQPVDDGFALTRIPLVKTSFDDADYVLLQELGPANCISGDELLSRLKSKWPQIFSTVTPERFRKEFLNKLDGRGIERQRDEKGAKTPYIRLSGDGQELIELIEDPIFQALTLRGRTSHDDIASKRFTFRWEELLI
ncbi:MAG: hypothetical protein ACREDR_15300 [Blastocatellia bacterium]